MEANDVKTVAGGLPVSYEPGTGTALVFLHYWGGSGETFAPVAERLPGRPVVRYDQRGWGAARELPGPYGLTQLADDALRVVDELGLSRYVLIGHSMGGKVAQLVAARRPDGLAGLVLVAPAPPRPAEVSAEEREALAHAYDNAETVTAALDHVLTHRALPDPARVVADSLNVTTEARLAWPRHGIIEDIADTVAAIEVPVLVLAGEHDQVDPPAVLAERLLPVLPTATMSVLRDTGHLSPLEVPDEVAAHVERFVAAL
ncbi:Pimeloyl-ACP methyl ester carboxylesterase [Amycolatopsis sacchari]|uniref:Pimeloyl-ACP methyl ester carboxylesterase n=1 Tax=Amycolatopsis sacchari TaxID=115433 RepID=A0A1I3MAD8_9PSEU|nr:alpha/beta hydrolase [Amycolatopsis sacchari]SFI93917.1 Pimeloyl-ACP methyl ester carboxylesterase [Amycolatopsis sacchari]